MAQPTTPTPLIQTTAALYLRVSTGRQAESDLSIPDQRRQLSAYSEVKTWPMAEEFVEPGNTATDDRRPAFQKMIDAAMTRPAPFQVILVHSFSRFFRDQFQFEFYARKLAKNGVRIISITQEVGDDPMGLIARQMMNLFDELPIQGKRQTHLEGHEGKRPSGLLERRAAADRLSRSSTPNNAG